MPYKYLSSDGRKKATLEDALVQSRDASGGAQIERNTGMGGSQPWTVGWQMSERHLMWNDDLAARLLKVVQDFFAYSEGEESHVIYRNAHMVA